MLPALNRTAATRSATVVAGLAGFLTLAACCHPALAQKTPSAEVSARDLAADVLGRAGGHGEGSLGEWARGVIEGALDRAGQAARQTASGQSGETAPLPAERHAGELSGSRSGTAEVLVFISLSVSAESWRQWAHEAARSGAPLVLRGVGEGGLRATVKEIGGHLGGAEAGVAIDPRLFRLFGITRVPAVVVVPGGVPPCRSRACATDPTPPHDLVAGNIGLTAALLAIAEEGTAGRKAAGRHLERLRGEDRR